MDRVIIWLVVCAAFAALCVARPNAGRVAVGLFFLAMALGVNGAILLVDPQTYVTFAGESYIAAYRELALRVVTASPVLFGLAVAAYEMAAGLLMLGRGRAVTLGLAGAALFLVGIVPLGVEEVPGLLLAAALASLVPRRFDTTLPGMLRARFYRRRSATTAIAAPVR